MKKTFKKKLIWFLILNAGLIVTAAGIALFKAPNHFAIGGTSGLAILLAELSWKGNMFCSSPSVLYSSARILLSERRIHR